MSDLYTEVIVKRKTTAKDILLKSLLIAATVLAALAILFTTLGVIAIIALIALAVADYFLMPAFSVEYEYLYVNGELDVDKILSKQKRKRVYSMDTVNLELMAPTRSHALDSFRNRQGIKAYDFSSREADAKTWTMVVKRDKGMELVIFEPNDVIVKDMKRMAPREVQMD